MESIRDIIYQHLSVYLDNSYVADYKLRAEKSAKRVAEQYPEKYSFDGFYQYLINSMPSVGHEKRDGYDYFWYSACNDFEYIKTIAFRGTLEDVSECIITAAEQDNFGSTFQEDIPKPFVHSVEERPVSDFHDLFVMVLEGVSCGCWLSEEAADHMAQRLSEEGVRLFFSSFHYGYLGGGLFAFLRESTEEIVVLILDGTD